MTFAPSPAEPSTEPLAPRTLDRVIADAAARMSAAAHDRHAAMHAPVVATADGEARIMVLRGADADLTELRFHTDLRSPKVATIAANPHVTVLAYDPVARVQLRLIGRARIESNGPAADAAWAKASPMSRRIYLTEIAPGAALAMPGSALPARLRDQRPTLAQSEAGRVQFAVVRVQITTIDWLQLGSAGGTRARFDRADDGGAWQGMWIAP